MFSCGKNVAALVIARLVDQGHLRYDAKVSEYWPEFGANDKVELKVEDILRHEGGLTTLKHSFQWNEFATDSIKQNVIGNVIEKCKTVFPSNNYNSDGTVSKRGYHSVTRGLILNEIVRRVDPKGRTIGEICRDDLQLEDLYCGIKEAELSRVTQLEAMSMGQVAKHTLLPYFLGSQVHISIFDLYRLNNLVKSTRDRIGSQKPVYVNVPKEPYLGYKMMEEDEIRKGELPSANFIGNAKGLGKLASVMANKGKTSNGEDRIISEETWDKMHGNAVWSQDAVLGWFNKHFLLSRLKIFRHNMIRLR